MIKDLNNKVAVVTGAGGGIGRALCVELASKGCHLALVDINEEAIQGTVDAVAQYAVNTSSHTTNITDRDAIAALASSVVEQHGKVNLLINNAGITLQKSFAAHTVEDWERVMNINLWGVIYGIQCFLPHLRKAGENPEEGGHVVNMSSIAGLMGMPSQASYAVTKAAVKNLSECLNAEFAQYNIGVTAVHPGAVKTNIMLATIEESEDVEAARKNNELAMKVATSPEAAAKTVVKAILKNKIRQRVGKDAVLLDLAKRWFPAAIHAPFRKMATKAAQQSDKS